ncbi:MAG TPA: fructose-6-phosphate aldolase [Clostridiales bacterium UBA8153]|nr:fructose-6-phosphate aldolase [Clostridiales bacterium UBA8153]
MRIFLDTANLDEIAEAAGWGVIAGVTTNPSLVAKEKGRSFPDLIAGITALVSGPVSAEVMALERDGMIREARELHRIAPNVVIKLPMTAEGLRAGRVLSIEGIPTNMTLVFSVGQGLLAALSGATYVSPFVGRLDDVGHAGMEVVADLVRIFQVHRLPTQVIAASIRHPQHVVEAARAGAHIATVPFGVLRQLVQHPLTDLGIARFLADSKHAQPK